MRPGLIGRGRVLAESQMTATFTAYAPNGTTSDADGATVPDYVEQTKPTPGKVQGTSAVGKDPVTRTVSVGDVELPVIDEGLHLPLSSYISPAGKLLLVAGPRGTGWELLCTAVSAEDDPSLVGRRYLVVSAPAKNKATARRLDVVELPPPPPVEED